MVTNTNQQQNTIDKLQGWLNDHGHPSYDYLHCLYDEGDPALYGKLTAIARDLSLTYDPNISLEERFEAIFKAVNDLPEKKVS
ncbi:MAG: hypothetical protein WC841_05150 [Candidatus Shapirobacteria bacterium]|jgi:hypothetical protein